MIHFYALQSVYTGPGPGTAVGTTQSGIEQEYWHEIQRLQKIENEESIEIKINFKFNFI